MYRIAFIGPESTAKSSLCAQLAIHYKTNWVPEFSRHYIGNLKKPYTQDDVLHCIKKQIEEEKKYLNNSADLLFTDNESINGKVWLLDKYNNCPAWVNDEIENNPYDLYLLTYPDINFVADDVRENENRRMFFYEWYKKELDERKLPYQIIRGIGEERFQNAIRAIEGFMQREK